MILVNSEANRLKWRGAAAYGADGATRLDRYGCKPLLRRPAQRERRAAVCGRNKPRSGERGENRADLWSDLAALFEARRDGGGVEGRGRRSEHGHDGGCLGEIVAGE